MKKLLSIVLVLLTCCFSMAFFTGCDKNPYCIELSTNRTFHVLYSKLTLLERFDEIDRNLEFITLTMYDAEAYKAYKKDPEQNAKPKPVDITYYDYNAKPTEKDGKKEYPSVKRSSINLRMAKLNGASIYGFNLDSPGKKTLNVSFMGVKGTLEITVIGQR